MDTSDFVLDKQLVQSPNGKESLPLTVLTRCNSKEEHIVVPDGVQMIAKNAFKDCPQSIIIELPDSTIIIDDYAFSGCPILSQVFIGENVENIPPHAVDSSLEGKHVCTTFWTSRKKGLLRPKGLKDLPDYRAIVAFGMDRYAWKQYCVKDTMKKRDKLREELYKYNNNKKKESTNILDLNDEEFIETYNSLTYEEKKALPLEVREHNSRIEHKELFEAAENGTLTDKAELLVELINDPDYPCHDKVVKEMIEIVDEADSALLASELGYMYAYGRFGLPIDKEKALKYSKLASELDPDEYEVEYEDMEPFEFDKDGYITNVNFSGHYLEIIYGKGIRPGAFKNASQIRNMYIRLGPDYNECLKLPAKVFEGLSNLHSIYVDIDLDIADDAFSGCYCFPIIYTNGPKIKKGIPRQWSNQLNIFDKHNKSQCISDIVYEMDIDEYRRLYSNND